MRVRDESKIETLLDEARTMIVKEGFDGLSMQKLAKAAGVSPATIYIYFKDRDDLLLQLYKRETDRFFSYIFEGFDPEMDFKTGFTIQWKNRAKYLLEYADKAHFMEHFKFTPLHEKAMQGRDPRIRAKLTRFMQKSIANHEMIDLPIEIYWSIAFAPMYNLIRFHKAGRNMAGEPFTLTDEIMDQTLALTLKALQP